MTTPDIMTCPECGTVGFRLVSVERIEGLAGIAREGSAATGYRARWDGVTEMLWDSSRTLRYVCADCGQALPEEHAVTLDRLLENTRQPDGAP